MRIILQLLFLSFLLVRPGAAALCQEDSLVYYFDKDLNACEQKDAVVTGVGVKMQSKFKFNAFYTISGIPLFNGWFSDPSLAVKEGLFTYFDSSGNKESEGAFRNNVETGYWITWVNGYIADSFLFEKGRKMEEISFLYHTNGKTSRKTVLNRVDDFTEITDWYESGPIKSKSRTQDGAGKETSYYENGNVESIVNYRNGETVKSKYFNEDGTEMSKEDIAKKKKPSKEKEILPLLPGGAPTYPGGSAGFSSFFDRNFKPPRNNSGQPLESVTVTFYLDKAGFAKDIRVSGGSNRDLEIEIQTVFRRMPAWNMNGYQSYGPINYTINLSGY